MDLLISHAMCITNPISAPVVIGMVCADANSAFLRALTAPLITRLDVDYTSSGFHLSQMVDWTFWDSSGQLWNETLIALNLIHWKCILYEAFLSH